MSAPVRSRRRARRAQSGYSPIEILIGLLIGLVLISGTMQLVFAMRQGGRAEVNLQQMQETGRFAMELVSRELRKTGFRFDRTQSDDALWPAVAPFAAGASLVGTDDSVTLRYQSGGDDWTRTCLGDSFAAGVIAEQTLFVQDGQLRCRARHTGTGATQTSPLLDQVEALSVTYGVDADADGFADAYRTAAAVADWAQVVSVNVQLRTVSRDDFVADDFQPFIDFDGNVAVPADRRLRRGYGAVVALRNRLP